MKHTIAVLAMVAAASVSAEEWEYKFSGGKKTGTYYRVGLNTVELIPGGTVEKSDGSIENLERVAAGTHQFAPVQLDAYAWWASNYPAKAAKVEVLGPLYKECAYIAVNCNGKVGEEDDLQQEGVTIAVGRHGGGTAVSWDYMRQLNPSYKKAAVVPTGGSRALGKLASSPSSGLDAVMWVIKPYPIKKNTNLTSVMRNENLCMIDLNDFSLNNKHKGLGRPIYEFQEIDVAKGVINDTEIEVPCVDAVMIANVDTDPDLLDLMADKVLNYQSSLVK